MGRQLPHEASFTHDRPTERSDFEVCPPFGAVASLTSKKKVAGEAGGGMVERRGGIPAHD